MTALILYISGIVLCIAISILIIKYFEESGCNFVFVIIIFIIVLFLNLKDEWKIFKRHDGTSFEDCSELLNIETFPRSNNNGILMFTVDTSLHDDLIAKIKMNNGKEYSANSKQGIFAIVLPQGPGLLEKIEFNFRHGLINNHMFRSKRYNSVNFNHNFNITERSINYIGHITRRLNPLRFLATPPGLTDLFNYKDNTYLYYIEPLFLNDSINNLLLPWFKADKLIINDSFVNQ